jgi:Asp-tRNA(Asn)/Glu-tRNA(Gln) amidotransferase A subunit family amidase
MFMSVKMRATAVAVVWAAAATASSAMAGTVNVVDLTVPGVDAGLAKGDFTSVDLVQAYLSRIASDNSFYNAFITLNPDALAQAAAADAAYATTPNKGPLYGVPVVVKDSMDLAGFPTTNGWSGFSSKTGGVDLTPTTDAPIVARLEAAGAIILGKTNLPAFAADGTRAATSLIGPTKNAYGPQFAPGASSSGTATSVAADFAVLGLAEETGGSIENPAGAQSLVGIKPTFGLVPTAGIAPLAGSTRDVAGPIAKTVYDAAVTLDVLAGYSPEDPKTAASNGHIPVNGYESYLSKTSLKGARIGLFGSGFKDVTLTPETQKLYNTAIAKLQAEGATVVTDPFAGTDFTKLITNADQGFGSIVYDYNQYLKRLGPGSPVQSLADYTKLTGVDIFSSLTSPLSAFKTFFPGIADQLKTPDVQPDLSTFFTDRQQLLDLYDKVLADNHLDGLVFPQMFDSLPPLDGTAQYPNTTVSEINLLGTPGVTVSGGYYGNGSPFSLIFMGPQFDEGPLLGYAYDYEQATMNRISPTVVPLPTAAAMGGWGLIVCSLGCAVTTRRRRAAYSGTVGSRYFDLSSQVEA